MSATAVVSAALRPATNQALRPRRSTRLLLVLASALILALGLADDLYGNTDLGDVYGSDAVQYLDISRAIQHHDGHTALNPLWSQGYPAILAAARPLFPSGPMGDWRETRVINFSIFCANDLSFLALLFTLIGSIDSEDQNQRNRKLFLWTAALALFLTTQICLGQVSRVNPDQLVNTSFFLASTLLLRLQRSEKSSQRLKLGITLGLLLGIAFLIKAVFLALSAGILFFLAIALWKQRRSLTPAIAAATIFAAIAGSYGAALSREVGHFTLSEAGSINYAWHVNRLEKWVHWEGGHQPASIAWPKPAIARFAQWDTKPPDFGQPLHPSRIVQESPRVYSFSGPFHATYSPYFNPSYWYQGYRHFINPRYQLIALIKSVGDLTLTLATHITFFAAALALAFLLRRRESRRALGQWLRSQWLITACCLFGIAIYLPVHLEGRYLAAFLALLATGLLIGSASSLSTAHCRALSLLLLIGVSADIVRYQLPAWKNALHHKAPEQNDQWKIGQAILAEHFPANTQVGVINWQPNLASDWAYIGQVEITSEIASPADMDLFWHQPAEQQRATLEAFHRAGATAVFSPIKPAATAANWQQLGNTSMWIYRF